MSTREVIDRDAVAAFARQHASAVVDVTGNQEIRLDDVEVREHHVERRVEDPADRVPFEVTANQKVQIAGYALVL